MQKSISLLTLSLLSFAPHALAGGYQLLERNAQGLGRSYAGEAALARDASVLGSNPAGMSRLKRPSFSISASTIDANLHVDVEEAGVEVPALAAFGLDSSIPSSGIASSNKVGPEFPLIPAAYAVLPLNEQYTIGLGVFSNFSSETNYESSFVGSLLAEKSEIRTININPSMAFAITPKMSVGVGFNAVHLESTLSSANPNVAPLRLNGANVLNPQTGEVLVLPTGGTLGSSEIKGDDWAYGWNAGVLVEPLDGTRFGLAYRSPVQAELEGDATFQNTPDVDAFTDFAGYAPLELPAIVSFSVAQEIGAQWTVSADITQTRWSNFKDLTIYRQDYGQASSRVDERWEDANRYAIGLDYSVLPSLGLSLGYAYDSSPIPDERRTLRIPTGDMRWLSAGLSYQVNEAISLDAGWAHVMMSRTGINDERSFVGRPFTAEAKGSAKAEGNIFGTQLNVTL